MQDKDTWKLILIEALCVVKCNKCLRKLGLNIEDLREQFLPDRPETNLYIHPILKALYYICEQLLPAEVNNLTRKIEISQSRTINTKYFELSLLYWLSDRLIDVGDWSQTEPDGRIIHCELKAILGDYL